MTTTFKIVNGDVVINASSGSPIMVADDVKLRQDVKEMLSTETVSGGIGAGLQDVVDGSPSDLAVLQVEIAQKIRRAIRQMQSLQETHHRAERPRTELIDRLALLRVTRLENFDTAFAFRVEIVSVNGATTTTSGVIT